MMASYGVDSADFTAILNESIDFSYSIFLCLMAKSCAAASVNGRERILSNHSSNNKCDELRHYFSMHSKYVSCVGVKM